MGRRRARTTRPTKGKAHAFGAFVGTLGVTLAGYVAATAPMHPDAVAAILIVALLMVSFALRVATESEYRLHRRIVEFLLVVVAAIVWWEKSARADVFLREARSVDTGVDNRHSVLLEFVNRGELDTDVDMRTEMVAVSVNGGDEALGVGRAVAKRLFSANPNRSGVGIIAAGRNTWLRVNATVVSVKADGPVGYLVTGTLFFRDWAGAHEREFCVFLAQGARAASFDCSTLPVMD